MRAALTLTAAALFTTATGCEWLKKFSTRETTPGPVETGPVRPVAAADLVRYLNSQSNYLQTVRYSDVYIDVYPGKEHYTLNEGTLVCAKPRNFLLVGGRHIMSNLVNIGSNDREFWMYSKVPDPTLVYCAHADFPQAARQLPFPFDPDWALQALGMTGYDPTLAYRVEVDEKNREHVLTVDATTPQGAPIKKAVVFAADPARGNQPQVRRHLILDANNKVIGSATVKEAAVMSVGTDPQTGKPAAAYVPTRVALEWPQQQFKMELTLRNVKVNERISDDEAGKLFTKPAAEGVTPINLAEARFTPSSYRGATPAEGKSKTFGRR